MPQRMIPTSLPELVGLTGTVADVDEDPDTPDAAWLLAPALGTAAAKTLYLKGAVDAANWGNTQEGGTAPAAADYPVSSGWVMGNQLAGFSSEFLNQIERGTASFSSNVTINKPGVPLAANPNGWRSPTTYTGRFAAGTWTFQMRIHSVTANWPGTAALRFRVWRSPNTDGSAATEVTSGAVQTATSTVFSGTVVQALVGSASLAQVDLNAEFLFITMAVIIVTAATGTGATRDLNVQTGPSSQVATPVFTPLTQNWSLARVGFGTPTYPLRDGAGLQEFRCYARKKGTGPNVPVTCQLWKSAAMVAQISTSVGPISSTTGEIISFPWDSSLVADGAGIESRIFVAQADWQPGSTIEWGAIEWNAMFYVPQALSATASVSPTIGRFIKKIVQLTSTATATIYNRYTKLLAAASTVVASLLAYRGYRKTLAATSTSVVSQARRVGFTIKATSTSVATYLRYIRKTITATSTGTPQISRTIAYLKSLIATSTAVASISRRIDRLLTLTAEAIGVPTIKKHLKQLLEAISTATADMSVGRFYRIFLDAVGVGTGSLTINQVFKQLLAATSIGTARISKQVNKIINTFVTGNAVLRKRMFGLLQATSVGTGFIKKGIKQILSAQSTVISDIQKLIPVLLEYESTVIPTLVKQMSVELSTIANTIANIASRFFSSTTIYFEPIIKLEIMPTVTHTMELLPKIKASITTALPVDVSIQALDKVKAVVNRIKRMTINIRKNT